MIRRLVTDEAEGLRERQQKSNEEKAQKLRAQTYKVRETPAIMTIRKVHLPRPFRIMPTWEDKPKKKTVRGKKKGGGGGGDYVLPTPTLGLHRQCQLADALACCRLANFLLN